MATLVGLILIAALSSTTGQDNFFSSADSEQSLVTRIQCQAEETQHFTYSSTTKLWGSVGGNVVVTADIALHCMGGDRSEKSEGLRYLAEITNMGIEQKNISHEDGGPLIRRKRGIGDFFSDAWTKIRTFFTQMFGGRPPPPPPAPVEPAVTTRDGRDEEHAEEKVIPDSTPEELKQLYAVPFQFVQLPNGSVREILFSENEVQDGRIKNFKRHLVDAFATHMSPGQKHKDVLETTITGEHTSSYDIDVTGEPVTMNIAGLGALHLQEEPTVIVNKTVTEDKIHKLSPSDAVNDRERLQMKLQQTQVYKGGKLLQSSGTSSIVLLPETPLRKKQRHKRDNEDDLTSNFRAHSTFNIQLRKRQRRSAEEAARLELHENLTFLPASRFAEKESSSDKQKLRQLQKSFGGLTALFQGLMDAQDEEYDEKMLALTDMLQREIELKLDNEPQSASNVVRNILTKDMLYSMCSKNFTVCKDFLQLLAIAGGPKAEEVFLSFLNDFEAFQPIQSRIIASIITDLSNPSPRFLDALVGFMTGGRRNAELLGSVSLSCGSLGSKAGPEVKNKISATLVRLLKASENSCEAPHILIDLLEAIGNLNCRKTVPSVLEVSRTCHGSSTVQIACAHALRHHADLASVELWIQDKTDHEDCEVIRAVVGSLSDKVQEQQMVGDVLNWPRSGFNQVDENLKTLLTTSRCSLEDIIFYFSKKKNKKANDLADTYFAPETEPWNSASRSRQKRALWDNLKCDDWAADDKFRPIQGKEEFATDRAMYNKRKSCLAYRRIGVKGANAEIYAGMFAGVKEPSEPLKYKLFTKFVSSLNFLDHQMEIGSFYFYLNGGSTKAYVRIFGQTRQELSSEGCLPMALKYRPVRHIPLYEVNVYMVQITLGVHLSSQMGMDSSCPNETRYMMEPRSDVRVGGEAVGSISFAKASFNVGGNFNYKLQLMFTPTPNMCLRGSHGYDPMSISFETYYQLWNVVREDWGRARFWRPRFLSWDISRGSLQPWFDDTCIRTEDMSPDINMEREIE